VGKLPLTLSIVLTAVMVGTLLWFSGYGFDFTDESFYLVWMSSPFNYSVSTTQFGFIYHPLYRILGGDIAGLRQANIIIIFSLAWCVCDLFLKQLIPQLPEASYVRPAIAAAIATSSLVALVFGGMWMPTPSYNSLAFQGLLVITIGLLLAEKLAYWESNLGWVLIGLGGWLAFVAKPSTAAAAGVAVILYLLLAGKLTLRLLVAPLIFLLLLVFSALAIDGSVIAFIERNQGDLELAKLLQPGFSFELLWRLEPFQLQSGTTKIFWIAVLAAIAGFLVSLLTIARSGIVVAIMQVLIIVVGLASIYHIYDQSTTPDRLQNLLLGAVLIAAIPIGISTLTRSGFFLSTMQVLTIVVSLAYYHRLTDQAVTFELMQNLLQSVALFAAIAIGFVVFKSKSIHAIPFATWALVLPFVVFPYAYAFGTNNNYWVPIGCAGLFFVLIALTLLCHLAHREEFPRLVLTLAIVVQVISAALLVNGLKFPYRQPSQLHNNDFPIDFGKQGGRLLLTQSSGKYISAARDIAFRAGLAKGTPMIDMTGRSPGMLHVLGANSVGSAWLIGGYPGSAQFVETALRSVRCDQLAETWLLTEPKGPRAIPESVLASFGANMLDDFEVAGVLDSPDGYTQKILKPTRSKDAATAACRDRRANHT
jgi:hypothetical protein